MKNQIVINIPTNIPRILTPNRSWAAHWSQVAHAKKQLQIKTLYSAIDARNTWLKDNPGATLPFKKGELYWEIIIKDRRSLMDDDNAIAGLKFCRDMLQVENERWFGAGIIADDRDFVTGRLTWTISKEKAPMLILTVVER